ncbi:MAG: flagellin [Acidobacteria bacterium]|nr:flagellin [Acidobacteriota bacterium]
MSLGVLNNISAIYAQNSLSQTQNSLSKTLQQLSSGSRINSGADDAAGLAVADGLSANATALAQSSRNANDAIGLLQTADGALAQVTTLLTRAVTLAAQASNGTLTSSQVSSANQEFQNILTQINNIGASTNFNGNSVFSSTAKTFTVSDGTSSGTVSYVDTVGNLSKASIGTSAVVAATSASVSLTTPTASAAGTASTTTLTLGGSTHTVSGTLALKVGSGSSHSITVASGTTMTALAAQINADSTFTTAGISASLNSTTGVLTISGPATASSDLDATGTTLSDTTPGSSGGGVDFTATSIATLTSSSAQSVLTNLGQAISDVAYQRGTLGANINQLTSAQQVAAAEQTNLTAAEDSIRATDYAQAASNLAKFQVLSQTGISALAQANSAQQAVLKLLQ